MIAAGIAILTGILLACFLPESIDAEWLPFLPAAAFLAYINPRWRSVWLIICGFLWVSLHIHWALSHRLANDLNNKRVQVHGEVLNLPVRRNESTRFLFSIDAIEAYSGTLPRTVRLSWRDAPKDLQPGQRWSLPVKLRRPHGFQNPGGFDYERWLFFNQIDATGYVYSSGHARPLGQSAFNLHAARARIRQHIARACQSCTWNGLIQALAIGYRGEISTEQRNLLQRTGTAHLIAISGLHIGIVAGWMFVLGRVLWQWAGFYQMGMNRREFALTLSWCAALVYSLLSGFDLPAQRAMLMLSVVFAALWGRLPINLLHGVFSALILILLVTPLSVLSVSFWLSFSALGVIGLGLFLLNTGASKVKTLIVIQLLFSLLFIPLTILIFDQVHVGSFVANLVAVPLVSLLVVPAVFIAQLLFFLPIQWLQWLYRGIDWLLNLLLGSLDWLQASGLQAIAVADISWPWLVLLAIWLVMLVVPRGVVLPRLWLALLPLALIGPGANRSVPLAVSVLDVGMGTSIVVQTMHHALVYDFGPGRRDSYSLGQWVVEPYLRHRGIDHVDRVVISHADQDHLGGFYALYERLDYGEIYSGTADQVSRLLDDGAAIRDCHRRSAWQWDGIEFEFLSAGVSAQDSDNDRSCVLSIRWGDQRILIAGDIEQRQEANLLRADPESLQADILIAPHHGSKTSSSPAFVDAVNAGHVVFTVGYLNRWSFPRPEIVQRYLQTDAQIYRTDLDGAVLIECEQSHCQLRRYRQLKRRLWY